MEDEEWEAQMWAELDKLNRKIFWQFVRLLIWPTYWDADSSY